MMKMIKQMFCKHEFIKVNEYITVMTNFGHREEEKRVVLYCPKCDFEKVERKDDFIIEEKTRFKKKEAKEEYLKSLKEKSNV